jgi:hypothetical protein
MTPLQMELHTERKARLARMAPRPRISAVPTPTPATDQKPVKTWFRFIPDGTVVAFPGRSSNVLRIADIQRTVAEHFKVTLLDLNSARRTGDIVRPRQIAMYLARKLTSKSLPEIGRRCGRKDHTTVLHAVTVCERILKEEEKLAPDIRELSAKLESYAS